ncbi:succinic semialdehyde dehydrogenase [Homoserinibacter sp. YIM 151385]|uniref:succinic semialdehyde dehydrogenase n=1 Tax=Homoserinibacter sp. YIM 151385 TaxID=2985506 RepID=UPI0022F08E35|nr:succinic semialdehyde dehydrogenase [Homoserinibacter sp. YIM 151385]WBU38137.1 succinic semialdehyde dehydrogenase [Homoserinibacter sp. YIM 151385]
MTGRPIPTELATRLAADLTASGAGRAAVVAPFTGEVSHELPRSTPADVEAAAAGARAAQRAWAARSPAARRRILLRAHGLLLERRELLLDAVQTETGKTRGQAFEEIFNAAAATRYAAVAAPGVLRERPRRAGIPLVIRTRVGFEPKGLVGIITPWNYPLSLAVMDAAPALATGNAVLMKADDQGALSILLARRAFLDAGVPAGLWPVVAGPGAEIGSAVIDAADAVCFTGSTATGRTVAQRAAGRLVSASLELGGKNPVIVLDDADPERAAADVAAACFAAAGQLCVSAERVIVERGIADAFVPAFAARVASLRLGTGYDYRSDVGSLATAAQLERVTAHIDDAVAKGAAVLAGGRHRPELGPYVVEPTVLADVTADMACHAEETFGPVVAVTVVADAREAVRLANEGEFGLNASIMSGSRARARRVARGLLAGSVNINEGYRATFSSLDAPMGGMKQSGLGRRNGREGLLRFVESRTVAEATGLLQLPRTGEEYARMSGPMLLLLRALGTLRRR